MLMKFDYDTYVDPTKIVAVVIGSGEVRLLLESGDFVSARCSSTTSPQVLAERIKNDINKALKEGAE